MILLIKSAITPITLVILLLIVCFVPTTTFKFMTNDHDARVLCFKISPFFPIITKNSNHPNTHVSVLVLYFYAIKVHNKCFIKP